MPNSESEQEFPEKENDRLEVQELADVAANNHTLLA